jgi:hypothetical protein
VENGHLYLNGPVRLCAEVLDAYDGPPVHLEARQVSRAD